MSHVDQGPLPSYNSLADHHLAGYFTNTRMRRHLRKAGLVNRHGEIVTENTYRLNMSRKEHKQHVKDMLAQAIVHKTLDLERARQAEIRRKLEEIAKIELVRRVRASRQRCREADILPYISPRSSSSRPSSGPDEQQGAGAGRKRYASAGKQRSSGGKRRPISGEPASSRKGRRPISALSSCYDDDEEGAVVYLDDEGRPITPAHVDEAQLRYASKDPIDTRHLYSLDTAALRKYATLMARMEQGRGGPSPYLTPQIPLPPKSPKSPRTNSARRTPRSVHRFGRSDAAKSMSPKRPSTANQAYLHPSGGSQKFKGQQESLCQVLMVYHGSSLTLARELLPGRAKQEVVVEQQHCGGNTLTVFRDSLERGAEFSFISYRHRGYPFSLSIYIDGKMDCRVSTCCEYRHKKGGRIGGKKGHFSITGIESAVPCYKCQVEKGIRVGNQAPRPKLKRPPEHHEEVVVLESNREPSPKPQPEPAKAAPRAAQQILVPVEDGDDKKAEDQYDEDFDSSSTSSSSDEEREAGPLEMFQPKDARGVEKTTGKVDINEVTSDEDTDQNNRITIAPVKTAAKKKKKGQTSQKKRRASASSGSSRSRSGSSSDSESEVTARREAQAKAMKAEQPRKQQAATPVTVKGSAEAHRGTAPKQAATTKGGNDEGLEEKKEEYKKEEVKQTKVDPIAEDKEVKKEPEKKERKKKTKKERRGSSSSASSKSSSSSSSSKSKEGSTRDYSDSDGEGEKKAKDSERKEISAPAPVIELEKEEEEVEEKEEAVAVKGEVAGVGGAEEEEEEELEKLRQFAKDSSSAPAVVEVADTRDEGEEREQEAEKKTAASPPPVETGANQSEPAQAVEDNSANKRRNSGASIQSSSSVASSSSSSGSATIEDKGPNTLNDPTAAAIVTTTTAAAAAAEAEVKHSEEAEVKETAVVVSATPPSVEVAETKQPEAPKKTEEDHESEDSGSDSGSSSDSDNGADSDQEKKEKELNDLLKRAEEEEKERKRKLEEEEIERQRKLEEEERIRKADEEEKEKTQVTPSVTVSAYSGPSSGGSSGSDSSDSDDDNVDGEKKAGKGSVVHIEADVHRRKSVQSQEAESDADAAHGGNDPDNVANNSEDHPPSPAPPPPATVPKVAPGSIQPLLEKSRSMVEIKGITLNKSQLYECAEHLTNQGRISQINLVNCNLDDNDVQKVSEALKASSSNPVLLNLSLNPLSSACVTYILDLLEAKPSIEAVLLQGTRLGDLGVEMLVEGLLRQHRLKKEERSSSQESLKELRELDLSDCKIGDDGAKALARLINSDMEVDTLTLSSNEAVSEAGWTFLGQALARNSTLETLTLDHNLLGDPGVRAIAAGLRDNTSVTALDLNDVGVTQVGGRALVELLKANTTLLEITLTGNSRLDKSTQEDINRYIGLNKSVGGSQSQSH